MQDIVAMLVTHNREGHVILAVACNENACFECEVNEAFENAWGESATTIGTGTHLFKIGIGFQYRLAMAIITAGTGFEHGRVVNLIECRVKLLNTVDGLPRCGRRAMVVDELLLVDAILRDTQQIGALRCRCKRAHFVDGVSVHVFELVREYIGFFGQFADCGDVVIFGSDLEISHLRSRAVRCRVENSDAEAHIAGRQRHHTAKLTATDNADGGPWHQTFNTAIGFLRQAGHWIQPPFPSASHGIPAGHWPDAHR